MLACRIASEQLLEYLYFKQMHINLYPIRPGF
jgi:hypothetical protein